MILTSSQVILHKPDKQIDLSRSELIFESDHAISAFGDVAIDLFVGLVFVFSVSNVGYYFTVVKRFAFGFRAVTDRTVLAKER